MKRSEKIRLIKDIQDDVCKIHMYINGLKLDKEKEAFLGTLLWSVESKLSDLRFDSE